jgi:uncharacterized protein (DUF885 family)
MTTETQFYADAQTMFDELLRDNPLASTFLGDHRYDNQLGVYTQASLDDQRRRYRAWLDKFAAYDDRGWSLDAQIDRTLSVQVVKRFLRDFEKLRTFQRNPGGAVDECLGGVYGLVLRDFAPLPERMKSILGRLRATPRVLAEGKALSVPVEVPKVWAEVALESAQQGVGLVAGFVPMLAQATPDLQAEVNAAAQTAAAALQEYAAWLEKEVLPQAQGDFAVGKELFDEILEPW